MELKLQQSIFDEYARPDVFVSDTGRHVIGQLGGVFEFTGIFKWTSYSEINFKVMRMCPDMMTGELNVNPYYDLIETPRLLKVEGFGYFIIREATIVSDIGGEHKEVVAYSSEYDLSTKYVDNFWINTGTIGDKGIDDNSVLHHITFYNANAPTYSLMHLLLNEAPHWKVGHIDENLKTEQRTFSVDRENIYDFLINEVAPTMKCVFVFDTYNNLINIYNEDTAGYDTDVYVSFENLAKNMNVSYKADDIKTVLKLSGANDLNVSAVNMGLESIMNLEYYNTEDWMGKDLYKAYNNYVKVVNDNIDTYKKLEEEVAYLQFKYGECYTKVSNVYKIASYNDTRVTPNNYSPSTYYYRREGVAPNYVYIKVDIPSEYLSTETYYMPEPRLTTSKIDDLNNLAINKFCEDGSTEELRKLADDFDWLPEYAQMLASPSETSINRMLDAMWNEYGIGELNGRLESFKNAQQGEIGQGISDPNHTNYCIYLANYYMLTSCERALEKRKQDAKNAQKLIDEKYDEINVVGSKTNPKNNFTPEEWNQLMPFLREDEYKDDCFAIHDYDDTIAIMKTKQALLEAGQKELSKLSKPVLNFEMDMANVYAIPEFEPIIHQFQLGNMVYVELREDYIKKVRLLQVELDFDNLANFTATFGELYNTKDVADIHADILKQAAQAGKSVASQSSYWQMGYDRATKTQERIEEGLLNANISLHAPENSGQSMELDMYGLHLRKYGEDGKLDQYEGWITNNGFFLSDDNFRTTKSVFGKFKVNDVERFGVISEAVLSGYVEGSLIAGGEIWSVAENKQGKPVTTINLDDGSFSFANGGLTYDTENGLTINGFAQTDDLADFATKTSLAQGTTNINGGCITTGVIKSNKTNPNGTPISQIDLSNGEFSFANGGITYKESEGLIVQGTITGSTLNGNEIYGGQIGIGKNDSALMKYNFFVDKDGNLYLSGNINMSKASNINWGSNNPVQYKYCSTINGNYHLPPMVASDKFRMDSTDGGKTWSSPYQFKGTDGVDGADGKDGKDGSNANVPKYIQETYIDATTVKSPTIESNDLSIYGGAVSLYAWNPTTGSKQKQGYVGLYYGRNGDNNQTTQGVTMSAMRDAITTWIPIGGFNIPLINFDALSCGAVSVTNAGAKLTYGSTSVVVVNGNAYAYVGGKQYNFSDIGKGGVAKFG